MLKKDPKIGKLLVGLSIVVFFAAALNDWILVGAFVSPVMLAIGILKIVMPERKERPTVDSSHISYNTSPLNRISSQPTTKATTPVNDKPLQRAFIKSYVTGLNYEGRQGIIASWKESMYEPYDGMTTKEMKAEMTGIFYKYPKDYETDALTFEPEPTNQYDPNAVRVIHKEMGFIGYIPKEDNVRLLKLLESKDPFYVESEVYGGQYKDVDDGEMTSNNEPFGISLRIYKNL